MASATEWPPATIRYRLNLSNALYSISPALSALHAARAAALHPEISAVLRPSHCPKCGTYRFSGDHPTYPPKRKKHKRSVSSLLTCRLCGFSIDAAACNSSPSLPANVLSVPVQSPIDLSRTRAMTTNETTQEPVSSGTPQPNPSAVPRGRQSHSKSHTKMSALKDMLSRDCKREEGMRAHEKKKEEHGGLAAFLKQL